MTRPKHPSKLKPRTVARRKRDAEFAAKFQTSDEVAAAAGAALRAVGDIPDGSMIWVSAGLVKKLAASCLRQDETKGRRSP